MKLEKIKIINFGFDPWSRYWKRNQTLFSLLNSTLKADSALFVNPAIWFADLLRNPKSIFDCNLRYVITRVVSGNIAVNTPVYLPYASRIGIVREITSYLYKVNLSLKGDEKIVLILNDLQADRELVDMIASKAFLTIFDWSDDFVEFSSNDEERQVCTQRCRHYCLISDIVLTINEDLKNRATEINENSYVIKNATNYFTFDESLGDSERCQSLRRFGNPVIGYIGWLNGLRLDSDLIRYVAESRPNYQFVFMGPKSEEFPLGTDLPRMKNIHIIPPVPYSQYPACLRALDVCILPNLINAHTNGNDPIKLYDYLASGNPVVATKTAGTEAFSDVLNLADNKEHFLKLLDHAIHDRSEPQKDRRIEIARQNSWQRRMVEVEEILGKFLS